MICDLGFTEFLYVDLFGFTESLYHREELSHLEITLISITELCMLKSRRHDNIANIIFYIYIEIYVIFS